MSRQILFCVESNNKARTDYQYIEETLKRFYKVDRKIRYRAIYLGSKTKYNAKDKVREINKNIKTFIGETTVIYFIDVDAIIADLTILNVIKTVDQIRDSRLTGACRTDKCDFLTGLRIQIHIVQYDLFRNITEFS